MEAEAGGSRIRFDGAAITIERTGRMARSVFSETTTLLPLSQITGVEWSEPGRFGRSGHIRFAVPGTQAAAGRTPINRDANAVLFGKPQRKAFMALRDAVQAALVSR